MVNGFAAWFLEGRGLAGILRSKALSDASLSMPGLFMFHNDGNPAIHAASADWMAQNLKRRIEVVFPIYDSDIFDQIETMMNLQ